MLAHCDFNCEPMSCAGNDLSTANARVALIVLDIDNGTIIVVGQDIRKQHCHLFVQHSV